jgi:preprotein translocase subunit YajC
MAGGGTEQQPNTIGFFLPIILIFAIMYLLIFRPQMKKQKQQKIMIDNIKKGDKVITVGGIMGTVVGEKQKEGMLIVKISDTTKIELVRTSVARVLGQDGQ